MSQVQDTKTPYVFERIVAPSVEGMPRHGEGDVIELAGGLMLMVYGEFYGGSDAAAATLQGLVSDDGGRTWRDKRVIQENTGGKNVMSVSLQRLPSGDILLLYLRKDEHMYFCTPFVRRSSDEGRTWSQPEPLVEVTARYHVVNNDRFGLLKGGRLLVPSCIYDDGSRLGDLVFFSDDEGRTWSSSGIHPFLPESKSGAQEPGVIELGDGRVMMWCRCDLGQIYRCYSEDGGETFGPWGPMGLKAPCSPASIKRLPSTGDLLCVFNNHETPPEYWAVTRSPLTAAVSSDDGATWRVAGNLEPDRTRSYCYTSVTFVPEGEVLLTYYLGRSVDAVDEGRLVRRQYNLSHLKVAVFEEGWLYRGSASRPRP